MLKNQHICFMKKLLTILLLLALTTKIKSQQRYVFESKKERGAALILGGVSLTTAAVLEGGSSYGTYIPSNSSKTNNKSKYVIPPFISQTPRNIMFFAGVTITITGLFTACSK